MKDKTLTIVFVCLVGYFLETEALLTFSKSVSGTVRETETSVFKVTCLACTDQPVTSVPPVPPSPPENITLDKVSITPSHVCGNCFDVYRESDILTGTKEWCVYYLPSQGKLNYTLVRAYTMTVVCRDGVQLDRKDDITIKVIPNEPPQIIAPPTACPDINAASTLAGATVYGSIPNFVQDREDDQLYCSMTTLPPSENFEIDEATCAIRAKNDLASECSPSVTFQVMVTDRHNQAIGPVSITCKVTGFAQPPNIPNLNTTAIIYEDKEIGDTVYTFDSPTPPPVVTYKIKGVDNPAALGIFEITDRRLKLRQKLNYEDVFLQNIRLYLEADNGECDPVSHYLDIRVGEVNEPPVLNPEVYFEQVDEERIYINPNYMCDDEDFNDKCTYRIIAGNDEGIFQINPDTGEIYATSFDIDDNVREVSRTLEIEVVDNRGLTDRATVNLNIRDINDNKPYFLQDGAGLAYTVTECTDPGVLPLNFEAFDVDSDYQGNNIITFLPSRSDCLQIHADGTVHLLKTLLLPESCTLSTRAVDQGVNPGQLTSDIAATVTITTSPCPETPAPQDPVQQVVNPPGTTVALTETVTALSANAAGSDFGIIFGILGGILGALLLASLLAWCCRRQCCAKKKTSPFSSEETAAKKKKKFDAVKKKKKAKAAAAAAAAAPAAVAAPSLVQTFIKVKRRIPFMRVKRKVPITTVRRLVPLNSQPPVNTVIPMNSAHGIRTVGPAPPPYRISNTAPVFGSY